MARTENERGSALLEAIPVLILLQILVGGLLLATYLLFARAWIQYASEQALYCVAEEPFAARCGEKLEHQLHEFLPWGQIVSSVSAVRGRWNVEVKWSYKTYGYHTHKQLTPRMLTHNRDLQW